MQRRMLAAVRQEVSRTGLNVDSFSGCSTEVPVQRTCVLRRALHSRLSDLLRQLKKAWQIRGWRDGYASTCKND